MPRKELTMARYETGTSDIAKLCKKYNIGHVINNAYGVQIKKIMNQINTACQVGQVDAYVQSTDKNL